MKLHDPFIITARLLPGLKIAGAFISLEALRRNAEGRTVYRYYIDLPDGTGYTQQDLKSGCQGGTLVEGFGTLLSFLGSVSDDTEGSLFPDAVTEWALQNSDEIAMVQVDLCDAIENRRPLIEEEKHVKILIKSDPETDK